MLEKESLKLLFEALEELELGFQGMPEFNSPCQLDAMRTVLLAVAKRMQDNFPYPHPLYVGQMLKPPHAMARLAYMLSMWINPNNHALDGGRASTFMEKEAVKEIAQMFGWETHLGHLCGGGTIANLEALWVAGKVKPGLKIVASQQSHYTHERICGVLGLPFAAVKSDRSGRMDVNALETLLQAGDIGTVVVTMGTTATGAVDPLPAILELRSHYNFRIHADAAYGGYFTLANNLADATRTAFNCLSEVDSLVIDPHKHGLQPYGCGCVIFSDTAVGAFYKHECPFTYFTSDELHLGEISLECSRPGAAAVALWATQRLLPYTRDGEFATELSKSRTAALALWQKIQADGRFVVPFAPELDILVWTPRAKSASVASQLAKDIFTEAAKKNLHLAIAHLPIEYFIDAHPEIEPDQDHLTCLRSCLIKPEHLDWVEDIWQILQQVNNQILPPTP
ncbi:aminotransferase class I/II-fold pyridoxal phosphate-dependent enzyme [Anabaena cylindrica UHCC 0172]|uniref:pyridoxal phosphate-dependent decarboxylase family protein n=1 Tax=Anabaena cylindrica TaxID=1165 RepID=UPI002B1F4AB7|nr:aminotransferase class I/II-fold pyridoxal phosphate-dependent enzyme [Anabaena cylindrica]MEA5552706.1 aminotransferase class I/II-fold pyridoxal phosphate-dependent enzyme [Anabaena cylindrica UHCC 0172]